MTLQQTQPFGLLLILQNPLSQVQSLKTQQQQGKQPTILSATPKMLSERVRHLRLKISPILYQTNQRGPQHPAQMHPQPITLSVSPIMLPQRVRHLRLKIPPCLYQTNQTRSPLTAQIHPMPAAQEKIQLEGLQIPAFCLQPNLSSQVMKPTPS